jgi:hypothetical protein
MSGEDLVFASIEDGALFLHALEEMKHYVLT